VARCGVDDDLIARNRNRRIGELEVERDRVDAAARIDRSLPDCAVKLSSPGVPASVVMSCVTLTVIVWVSVRLPSEARTCTT